MNEDIEIVKENIELFSKILKRVAKIVFYSLFLVTLLFCTLFVLMYLISPLEEYDTDGITFCAIMIFPLSAINYETAIVLLRRHHRILGVFHILLGLYCNFGIIVTATITQTV